MEKLVSPVNLKFLNSKNELVDSNIILLGIPLDLTATFREGTSNAPEEIRKASLELESYDLFYEYDIKNTKFCDIGDIKIDSPDIHDNFQNIGAVASEIFEKNKIPISMGGEHSITYPLVSSSKSDLIIQFDAHADLRDEFNGDKWTHASVMKRILDDQDDITILNLGLRALSDQELKIMKNERRFSHVDTYKLLKKPLKTLTDYLIDFTSSYQKIYVSIDVDVLDLASCPGVGNPEPGGIPYLNLKNIIGRFIRFNNKIIGVDVVELNPLFDKVTSPFIAAKIMFDMISILSIS